MYIPDNQRHSKCCYKAIELHRSKPSRCGAIREGSSWIQQRLSLDDFDQRRIWRKSPISISISTSGQTSSSRSMWFGILESTWTANHPWNTISAPSFVPASSIFAALNPSVESSVPMSRPVWYRLLWQPKWITATPFWQHFLSRQSIHCNGFRMPPSDSSLALEHESTSLLRFGVCTGSQSPR